MLLHERVRAAAERHADRPAIREPDRTTDYATLWTRAENTARALAEHGVCAGDRVALLAPKTMETIAAQLGALILGAVYVPIDAQSPAARTQRILSASEPTVILAHSTTAAACRALEPGRWLALDRSFEIDGVLTPGPERWSTTTRLRPPVLDADSPAHLLFTSGSTGEPKGVVITHGNVASFLDWAIPHFDIQSEDRLSAHPPLHFDLSTFDIFGTLSTGACLLPVPTALNLAPKKLAAWIRDSELTQWFSVPAVFQFLAKHDALTAIGPFPSLRRVLWCGEVLPMPALRYWRDAVPQARFTNLYGPTEATIASTYFDVPDNFDRWNEELPIGRPCAGEDVVLLDLDSDTPRLAAAETRGEIALRGAGLSPGYWRDAPRTAAAFPSDPEQPDQRLYRTGDVGERDSEGLYRFVGRRDQQIKSRGYRIELGEIEAALHALGVVREVAVVALPTEGFEGTRICAAFVAESACTPAVLRKALGQAIPSYMLPSDWRPLAALPKNANGKIDRVRLRAMFATGASTA